MIAALALLLAAAPPLIERVDGATVDMILLNDGDAAVTRAVPETAAGEAGGAVTLRRAPGEPARATIPPHGFVRVRYLADAPLVPGAALTVAGWNGQASAPAAAPAPAPAPAVAVARQEDGTAPPPNYRSADNDRGNRFLPNLTAYEPIYAVYGPGTDSDARLQISFKYQLLGRAGEIGPGAPWQNGIHFAFTQRLYWNLGAESSPFRNVDYLPELFYLLPARPVTDRIAIGGQFGFRHESNGRAGVASRSYNTLYVQPVATMPLGRWRLTLGPRAWVYVGSRDDNPDIRHYRGNADLFAEIGEDDGARLSVTTRLDPGSGRGALDALVSYPLDRVISRDLNLYAFGQGFVGYGENLLDYRRRTTRLRVGLGLVR